MNITYVTAEDIRNLDLETAKNVSEDKKTDIVFNGENLYYLGVGHCFLNSFFSEYITKSAIKIRQYSNFWSINNEDYNLIDDKFVLIPKEPYVHNPIRFEDLTFPTIKNVKPNLLSDKLISLKPE